MLGRLSSVALVCVTSSLVFATQARADWKTDLESALEKRYKLAKLTLLRNDVRQPGTVLLLTQLGVVGARDSYLTNDVPVKVGNVSSVSPVVSAPRARGREEDPLQVELTPFQPVFVTGVVVSKNRVTLQIATSARYIFEAIDRGAIARFANGASLTKETVNRVDISIRRAALAFDFGESDLRTIALDVVIAAVDQVLLPSDDPRAPQFGTVAIGMLRGRVILNLGLPRHTVVHADREVLVYDKIKVTLIDDKVAEVE